MKPTLMFSLLLFFILNSLFSCTAAQASVRADLLGEARVQILSDRITIANKRIECMRQYTHGDYLKNCVERIKTDNPELFYNNVTERMASEVEQPTQADIDRACSHLPQSSDPVAQAHAANCAASVRGKYFQRVELLRQGIDPDQYFQDPNAEQPDQRIRDRIATLETELSMLQSQQGSIRDFSFEGEICRAEGQEVGENRPSCLNTWVFASPGEDQFCRSISEKLDMTDKDSCCKETWDFAFFSDESHLPIHQRRIRGRQVEVHISGGPWHDQYRSMAKIESVVQRFVPKSWDVATRRKFGCHVITKVEPPEPEPEPEAPISNHAVVNIQPHWQNEPMDNKNLATVTINFRGTPPWDVYYRVEAYREETRGDETTGKWHRVGWNKVTFQKPAVNYSKDYYWKDAIAWRVVDVAQ